MPAKGRADTLYDQRTWATGGLTTEKGALSLEASLADWRRAHGELAARIDPEAARRLAIAAEALEEIAFPSNRIL